MHGLNRPITRQLPPVAQRRPAFSAHHGVELVDEYAWLRASNWQEVMRDPSVLDQQIRAYLEAENAYTDAALTDTAELQSALYAEMKARIKEDDSSVPAPDGAHEYFVSYVTGGQYPRLCRQPRGGGAEQVLLDGNKEAEGQRYWQLGAAAHSPDHRYLAYAVDKKGSELFTIKIRDLATGDVNRITHDRLELRRSEVELSSVIQQAVEVARPLVDATGQNLIVELPDEPVYLNADRARLAQVFGNLLNNSCKYTTANGTIRLTARRVDDSVMVSVQDNGAGIPPDKIGSIFDMFMQVDRTSERSQGGLGIGLTLVKRLVEMHRGSIEARSEGEGRGSEFIVRLPVICKPIVSTAVADNGSTGATERRVLIVDDNLDSADSLAMLLEISGNKTFLAHDGIEALDAVEKFRPEVMLLDIGLPKLDGHEVCRRVREKPYGRDIVIIALTGWGQDDDRRKSEEAGFNGHLVKPVDYERLLEMLDSK